MFEILICVVLIEIGIICGVIIKILLSFIIEGFYNKKYNKCIKDYRILQNEYELLNKKYSAIKKLVGNENATTASRY